MTLLVEDGAFADVVVAALNNLTHARTVKKSDRSGKYVMLTLDQAPSNASRGYSVLLVYRTIVSPYICKIKISPGIDIGVDIDTTSVDFSNAQQMGGGTTQAKDSRGASNPSQFDKWYESWARSIKPDWFGVGGSNCKIVWNPFPAQTLNWVGGKTLRQPVPAYIVLAHELSHADRMMRGTSLVGVVGRSRPPAYNAAAAGTTYNTMVDIEHIEMVGFDCPQWTCRDADVVTENKIRTEHNISIRCNY